jgi:membrane dipeptidase
MIKGVSMKVLKIAISLISVVGFVWVSGCRRAEPLTVAPETRADLIHDAVLTVDTHVDTPYQLLRPGYDISRSHDARKGEGRVDLPRMKQGGLDAIFFAVFVGQGETNPEGYQKAKTRALQLFEAIKAALKKHSHLAQLALTAADAYRIEKSGKRAIYIGMENGYPLGKDISLLKKYHQLGARYITLCHSRNNQICDSSTDRKGARHNGLSPFGKQVVAEMNRLGIMVDVSHISDQSFYDVLQVSRAPVLASHSCSRAMCDHPRNLDDQMLKKLAEKGGVIQMCILSSYVKKPAPNPQRDAALAALRKKYMSRETHSKQEREKMRRAWRDIRHKYPQKLATVQDVVDHIDHIVKVAGINHVGIGTDFDGGGGVDGCYDVSEMKNITRELVRRGYSEEQIRKIWGGNVMRVLRRVEDIARTLQQKNQPLD